MEMLEMAMTCSLMHIAKNSSIHPNMDAKAFKTFCKNLSAWQYLSSFTPFVPTVSRGIGRRFGASRETASSEVEEPCKVSPIPSRILLFVSLSSGRDLWPSSRDAVSTTDVGVLTSKILRALLNVYFVSL